MMRGDDDVQGDAQDDDDEDLESASEEERREAEALARALEAKDRDPEAGSLAEVAARVRAVHGEAPALDPGARRAMVQSAVASGRARGRRRAIGRGLAAAAAVLLAIGAGGLASYATQRDAEPLRYGGPTSALFDAPFAEEEVSSARLDHITRARARDYFSALAARAEGEP